MITVKSLTKNFGDVVALDNLSFEVEKGQIVGFLGANGAGKTTTMDILCGCIGADEGHATISGFDITDRPLEAKKRLGYLPDEPPLYNEMIVKEYIKFAAEINKVPRSKIKSRVKSIIEMVDLGEVQNRLVGNLSKGFRQRVALAQALVHDPEVLILDEPTEGLDPNQIIHIRTLIRNLAGSHTILLSSHILSEVENTCDRIIIINKGKIIHQGSRQEVLNFKGGSRSYKMRVANEDQKFVSTLKNISGVNDANINSKNFIEFSINDEEQTLDKIVKTACDMGHGVRELAPMTQSLEDVFQELTN